MEAFPEDFYGGQVGGGLVNYGLTGHRYKGDAQDDREPVGIWNFFGKVFAGAVGINIM